jgi:hypothetical protein
MMLIIYVALGVILALIIFSNFEAILGLFLGLSKLLIIGIALVALIAFAVMFISSGALVELAPMFLFAGIPLFLILLYMFLAVLLEKKADSSQAKE